MPRMIFVALATLLAPVVAARAEISLPAVIGDGMVLQQETSAPIWGWASAGELVRVAGTWNGVVEQARADERGRWMVHLATPSASGPFEVRIDGETGGRALGDVWIGEVWLCSGQSNMEWPLRATDDADEAIAGAMHPRIRLFTVERTIAAAPRSTGSGRWTMCTPDTAADFSAVAYHFGRELEEHLDVPVGLIEADWGGTVAEAWMSAAALAPFPRFADDLAYLEALRDPVRRAEVIRDQAEHWWDRLDQGAAVGPGWYLPGYDDRTWETTTLPGPFAGDLASFDGIVYYRKTIAVPASWMTSGGILMLGPIDDYDDVWFNGHRVGGVHEAGRWNEVRQYDVLPRYVETGHNVIAVRVLDTGGPGGFHGKPAQMRFRQITTKEQIELAGTWRYAVGRPLADLPPRDGADVDRNTASVLYNGMIAPLVPYALRGVIWYQGESNRGHAVEYAALFPALIADWRRAWEAPLPFYYVQIAPFAYAGDAGQTAALRDAQARARSVPGTGMVVTLDIGDPHDIHPRRKREVGRRLADWARARTYGAADVNPTGPVFDGITIESGAVRVRFRHAGGGLELRRAEPTGFEIAGADGRFVPAAARVEGATLVLSSPEVPAPAAVRYAWSAAPSAELFGAGNGLPAAPFDSRGE